MFRQWTDDALKNVCIEAQIQEVGKVVDKYILGMETSKRNSHVRDMVV